MIDISNARFAFLDIETTGLSPWFGDRICQIAVVLTEGKRIKTTLDLILNPEHEFSPAAFHVNKLDEEKLSASPRFDEVTDQLEAVLKDAIIVCHNAQFDLQFLDNEYRKLGRTAEYPNLMGVFQMS
jgi:DNA polymerase III epsilon subunit family exonuclease